jgi:integrase/recombinase XerD
VTHLRKMLLEELERRNYSAGTIRYYVRFVERFAQHFGKSPDKLGPDHVRTYQSYLLKQRKLSPGTVKHHVSALRFFYVQTLHRHEFRQFLPYPKVRHKLPKILSREEVGQLIEASSGLFERTLLMVLYGTGMRRAEVARLKIADIDSQRMILHVVNGKGGKDRDLPLSSALLETLRAYWRWLKPRTYLFPSRMYRDREQPITDKIVWRVCTEARKRAGIRKKVSPSLLRQAWAYYTTFQSPFILKTIGLGRRGFAEVYGHHGALLSPLVALPVVTGRFSR